MEDREKEIRQLGCRKKHCVFFEENNPHNFCGAVFCKKYCNSESDFRDNMEEEE